MNRKMQHVTSLATTCAVGKSTPASGNKKKQLLCCCLTLLSAIAHAQSLLPYVYPLSGTAAATTQAALKHGSGTEQNANTIPAVGLPFGMTQWVPQSRLTENKCIPPYFYKDSLFSGFRGTHWLSGSCTQDYGSFTIVPVTGKLKTSAGDYAVPYTHVYETATPAYYQLVLPAQHLIAEVTATLRCSMMQFTLQEADSLYVLITPNSDKAKGFVQVDREHGTVWGYNPVYRIYQGWGQPAGFSGYFFIQFEKQVGAAGTFEGASIFLNDSIGNKKDIGVYIGCRLGKGEQLRMRIGTSFSSVDGARRNLLQEIPDWDFNKLHRQAKQHWERSLACIGVQTNNEKDKHIFYTAMWHAFQHPRLLSDADGVYPSFAGNRQLQKMTGGNYYDDFSMWDIYRAQLPLLQITDTGLVNAFVRSMLLKGQQGGWLPIFPCWNSYTAAMIGDHVTAFIASAYTKGIRNYDITEAYRLMRKNAFETGTAIEYRNGMGRRALPSYLQYGFVPLEDSVPEAFHKREQVSRTLEYAYDDYALSMVAKALHKTDDYNLLHHRSKNYKNVFDTTVHMARGRYAGGQWYTPFNADTKATYITEGTPRQYTFYVPHDVKGLAGLMGGTKGLEDALDTLFVKNEYWHGNEPGHQIPFLYNYTESPWKTQLQVRKILSEEYSDGPGGLSGNDDAGQMSAWYVFAAMGFYPVDPVSGQYVLCAPLFDKMVIQLPSKKSFTINCHKKNATAIYISKVLYNGRLYNKNFISHAMLLQGGTLEIWLQDKPGQWASEAASRPPEQP